MAHRAPKWLGRMMARAALTVAALLTCAWVFNVDDREPSHSTRVGTLTVTLPEGEGTGTAFLVDACGILTNFHVAFGPWTVTVLHPASHDMVATFTLAEVTLPDGARIRPHARSR